MASREKKITLNRKQTTASPVPPKEGAVAAETIAKTTVAKSDEMSAANEAPKLAPIRNPRSNANKNASVIAKKIKRNVTKKVIKKTISMKAKNNKTNLNKKIGKKILSTVKNNVEGRKALLKNGIKTKINKKSSSNKKQKQENNDGPPILEPIFPINYNVKQSKKKSKKDEDKKIKEEFDDGLGLDEAIDSIINELNNTNTQPKLPKKKILKKIKVENISEPAQESIEEVMGDLTALIKGEDIISEPNISSDTEKCEPKSRKSKVDLLKKLTKKENLENKLEDENKVIDMFDLNVTKKKHTVVPNRRHSIEEFPVGCDKTNRSIFTNLPRSISPRARKITKARQSIEKRSSPYTTRSDSPARILRNGKHRRLKDLNLLEGLDSEYKKRKRLCSDYSGSEISASKSGYESDSSYSDLASLQGAETSEYSESKIEVKVEPEVSSNNENVEMKISQVREKEANGEHNVSEQIPNIDTNSNLCMTDNMNDGKPLKIEFPDEITDCGFDRTKEIVLDIMKQNFNVGIESEGEKRMADPSPLSENGCDLPSVSTGKFYGNTETKQVNDTSNVDISIPPPLQPISQPTETSETEINEPQTEDQSEPPVLEPMNIEIHTDVIIQNEYVKADEKSTLDDVAKDCESVESGHNSPTDSKTEVLIFETPESLAIKEQMLEALGLQSLKAAEEAKLKGKDKEKEVITNIEPPSYTGTLKTVIKLNKNEKKRGKKLSLQKSKKVPKEEKHEKNMKPDTVKNEEKAPTTTRDRENASTSKAHAGQSSDTAGALRKSHYANRSNMDVSSEHSDGDPGTGEDGKALVIPEKASSFTIHPGRLCKDECSYCFGKFGLYDTPCHIAQMKSVDRQNKILAAEKHLTRDSCLCDACYRHVDRKSNTPSYANNKSFKRNSLVAPGPKENHCHVLGCKNISTNILRRKWIIRMRKNICKSINLDLDNPGLHSIPICDEHFNALEHLMTCSMCKRKLPNHIHYIGHEYNELNKKLNAIRVPVKLEEKAVVCKLCKYYATLILTKEVDRPENAAAFNKEYTKRLLHYHDIEPMDEADVEQPIPVPLKEKVVDREPPKKKKKLSKSPTSAIDPPAVSNDPQTDTEQLSDQNNVPSSESRAESPSDYMIDYNTLIPNIALECGSDAESSKKEIPKKQSLLKKVTTHPELVKELVVISKNQVKLKNKSDFAVQRLGSNPSISVRTLFPGEEDLPLQCNIEFNNVKERTPEGWEKCTTVVQYDSDTKQLWQELQKPYGNQSSFLRHLILLEKYFRNGDLVLSPNASHHSINYSESVQNRLRAYDNTPTVSAPVQPLPSLLINKAQKSSSGIVTSRDTLPTQPPKPMNVVNAANIPKNTPITMAQLGLLSNNITTSSKQIKSPGVPPGLMPLQPGTSKPVTTLVKVTQPQKIKFPITKNWRPNLMPVDPNEVSEKKKGYVQVKCGGVPYHITVADYNKMVAIKRTFDLRQQKIQEAQKIKALGQKTVTPSPNSILRTMAPRKDLVISKTSTMLSPPKTEFTMEVDKEESSLEKLDRQVEKLESKFNEPKPALMILPKIPKSLTVIPQTVPRKILRPSSPSLQITPKPKTVVQNLPKS